MEQTQAGNKDEESEKKLSLVTIETFDPREIG